MDRPAGLDEAVYAQPIVSGRRVLVATENDSVYALDGAGLSPQRILDIRRVCAPVRVYNLRTDAPNTFFANGIAVHNKGGGGCFAEGTPVLTPRGEVAIERIRPGDQVIGVMTIWREGGDLFTQAELFFF